MSRPLVSVVIPLYKGGVFAEQAINSVLDQSFKDYEIVIVENNASEDSLSHVLPIVGKYNGLIRFYHESTQGVCSARNRGINESRGDLVALLDDDDLMYPDRLERQVNLFNLDPSVSIIACLDDLISWDGKDILSYNNSPNEMFWAKTLFGKEDFYQCNPMVFPLPSTMLFCKATALKAGLFDIRFNPAGIEDWDFAYRMYQHGPIKVDRKSGIKYRHTSGEFEEKKWISLGVRSLKLWEKTNLFFNIINLDIKEKKTPYPKREMQIIQSQWLRAFGCFLMRYNSRKPQAVRLIERAFTADPLNPKNWKSFIRSMAPTFLLPRLFHFKNPSIFPDSFSFPNHFEEDYFKL